MRKRVLTVVQIVLIVVALVLAWFVEGPGATESETISSSYEMRQIQEIEVKPIEVNSIQIQEEWP